MTDDSESGPPRSILENLGQLAMTAFWIFAIACAWLFVAILVMAFISIA